MITITPKNKNRIDLEISGKLDSEAMRSGLDELVEKSAQLENGKLLYTITDFKLPSFGAVMVELSRLPKLFGLIGKFDRAAVLADKEWIQNIGELKGKLFPGLEIKAFGLDELAEAEAWLEA